MKKSILPLRKFGKKTRRTPHLTQVSVRKTLPAAGAKIRPRHERFNDRERNAERGNTSFSLPPSPTAQGNSDSITDRVPRKKGTSFLFQSVCRRYSSTLSRKEVVVVVVLPPAGDGNQINHSLVRVSYIYRRTCLSRSLFSMQVREGGGSEIDSSGCRGGRTRSR